MTVWRGNVAFGGSRKPVSPRDALYSVAPEEQVDQMLGVLGGYEFHFQRSQENGNLGVFGWDERDLTPQQMFGELQRVTTPKVAEGVRDFSEEATISEYFVREVIEHPRSLEAFLRVTKAISEGSTPHPRDVIRDFLSEGDDVGFIINPNTGLTCVADAQLGHERIARQFGIDPSTDEYERYLKGAIEHDENERPGVSILTHRFHHPTERWDFKDIVARAAFHLLRKGVPPDLAVDIEGSTDSDVKSVAEVAEGAYIHSSTERSVIREANVLIEANEAGQTERWAQIHEGLTVNRSEIPGVNVNAPNKENPSPVAYIIETTRGSHESYILTDTRGIADTGARHGMNVLGVARNGSLFREKFKHDFHIQAPENFNVV